MLERRMPMGRNLEVGGKLNAEGERDCFVWWAFNYGNFRTRRGLGVFPFEINWQDHDVIGIGWVLRPCRCWTESSKCEGNRQQSDEQ